MGVALEIAKRANSLRYENTTKEAIYWTKRSVTDVVGVALAGSLEESPRILLQVLDSGHVPGPCLIMGNVTRTRPIDATLINGVIAHALDFDDAYQGAGHLSVGLFPAVLATAEMLDASGRDFIEAFLTGYETAVHLGLGLNGVNFWHYEKGWHPTATVGTFGSAAACGKLLHLSDEQMATALSICVSFASGVKSNFGTMTKPLHAGLAARNGLFAALLAQAGLTASSDAFEHPQGFFDVFNGPGTYDVDKILGDWSTSWHIVTPGSCFKQYPCVYSAHPAIAAAIRLRNTYSVTPEHIRKVGVCLHRRRLLSHTQHAATSGADAKFSLRYVIARALIGGCVILEHFEGDSYNQPEVRSLMDKIEAIPHDDKDVFSGYVTVTLENGDVLKEDITSIPGMGTENALSAEALKQKFKNCAGRRLKPEHIGPLYSALSDLENIKSIREFSALMEVPVEK